VPIVTTENGHLLEEYSEDEGCTFLMLYVFYVHTQKKLEGMLLLNQVVDV